MGRSFAARTTGPASANATRGAETPTTNVMSAPPIPRGAAGKRGDVVNGNRGTATGRQREPVPWSATNPQSSEPRNGTRPSSSSPASLAPAPAGGALRPPRSQGSPRCAGFRLHPHRRRCCRPRSGPRGRRLSRPTMRVATAFMETRPSDLTLQPTGSQRGCRSDNATRIYVRSGRRSQAPERDRRTPPARPR